MESYYEGYRFSDDKSLLQLESVWDFLCNRSYWAKGRSAEQVTSSVENSICIGIYEGEKQIGFARMVTDYAVMYWLCDVYVEEAYRGKGLGKYLMECIITHPVLEKLHGTLATADAQSLYKKFGFVCMQPPITFMRRKHLSSQ